MLAYSVYLCPFQTAYCLCWLMFCSTYIHLCLRMRGNMAHFDVNMGSFRRSSHRWCYVCTRIVQGLILLCSFPLCCANWLVWLNRLPMNVGILTIHQGWSKRSRIFKLVWSKLCLRTFLAGTYRPQSVITELISQSTFLTHDCGWSWDLKLQSVSWYRAVPSLWWCMLLDLHKGDPCWPNHRFKTYGYITMAQGKMILRSSASFLDLLSVYSHAIHGRFQAWSLYESASAAHVLGSSTSSHNRTRIREI